jgi:Zn-dependent protease
MFRNAFRLPFTLLGIPLLLDLSFLIILPLLAFLIGNQIRLYIENTGLPVNASALQNGLLPYLLGLVAALGLFVSVVIHELGHSIVARTYGVQVKSITLWLLGGMAQFEQMPRQPGGEAVVALAGPLTSFALAAFFWLPLSLIPDSAPATRFTVAYLAQANFVLAVFNLLPALPLDGGRVLRSLLALRLNHLRATQIAASISKFLAFLLFLAGLFYFNIFLMLIAFFIYQAVNAETRQTLIIDLLKDVGVSDLMTRQVKTVPPDLTVEQLKTRMLQDHHLGFPVVDGHLMGLVTLKDVAGADPHTRVDQVMSRQIHTIPQRESAAEAFERMSKNDFARLIVTDDQGQMAGILTKTDLMRALQLRLLGTGMEPEV